MEPGTRAAYEAANRKTCEENGVAWVRAFLAGPGDITSGKRRDFQIWLNEWEEAEAQRTRDEELAILREANAHAEEANRIARSARNWGRVGTGIALLALVVAAYAAQREFPVIEAPKPSAIQKDRQVEPAPPRLPRT